MTALSPQRAASGEGRRVPISTSETGGGGASSQIKNHVQRAFSDILSRHGQITAAEPTMPGCVTVASAFISRGDVRLADFIGCVTSAQRSLRFPPWNEDACKIGMCSKASPGQHASVLGIYNSSAFGHVIARERDRFSVLFRRKAMLHHYEEFVDAQTIAEAEATVVDVISDYQTIEAGTFQGVDSSTSHLFPAF